MTLSRRLAVLGAIATFLISASIYLTTLTPTVPFWDSGEFIAVANILGIPHPPGTPFYVLLGRCATLIPIASIAQRVNGLSALSSALAVLFTFLVAFRLIRMAQLRGFGTVAAPPERRRGPGGAEAKRREEPEVVTPAAENPLEVWLALVGALLAALMLAFSDNFWENSIEAEVYSTASLAQILVFWLGLRWWEAHEKRPTVGPLLVAVYVMWLCIGLHLGVGMMGLPLLALALLVDRQVAILFVLPLFTVLMVTFGLERMAGGVLLFATGQFIYYASKRKLNGWVAAAGAAGAIYGMVVAFGDKNFDPSSATIAAASILIPLGFLAWKCREGRILALILLLMAAGYSTHVYLPIRAAQHPAINEGDPSTWQSMRDLLERKQYGQMNMFERRSKWSNQINKEFWRYFQRQWPLFGGPTPKDATPTTRPWVAALVPLLLGLVGGVWHARRERVSFMTTGGMFAFATAGMIVFLNFTDHEVRDRDYFFTTGYHWYALWIGMGAVWMVGWVRDSFAEGQGRVLATWATVALLMVQPFLLMRNLWYAHDRRGNYVAHDYAYNMLAPLAPNSFIFTNGDNDTFPLWYMQQVEGLRKDVRVVNLSLLNTDWYITQLRDEQPKLPIALDDRQIRMLGGGALEIEPGRVILTNEFMVGHLMEQSRIPRDGWKKQPYVAVTVPEHYGLEKYFTLEGLVYHVNTDTLHAGVDYELVRKNIYDLFKYRGLFTADGSWDRSVYKDENAATLSRNYASAHLQLALGYRRRGQLKDAIEEMHRIARMFPDYPEVLLPLAGFYMEAGDTASAVALLERLTQQAPHSSDVRYYHGAMLAARGDRAGALREMEVALGLDPDNGMAFYAEVNLLWESGQQERALQVIENWLQRHPDDTGARQMLEAGRGVAPPPAGAGTTPPPRPPGMP